MNTSSPEKAALFQVAAALGGQARIAALLGYSDRRNVWPWFATDRQVPAEHCPALEREAGRQGVAVGCEQLRPDIVWHRVPDPDWPWHPLGRPTIDVTRQAPAADQQEARHAA